MAKRQPPSRGDALAQRLKDVAKARLTPPPYVPKVDPVFDASKRKD